MLTEGIEAPGEDKTLKLGGSIQFIQQKSKASGEGGRERERDGQISAAHLQGTQNVINCDADFDK